MSPVACRLSPAFGIDSAPPPNHSPVMPIYEYRCASCGKDFELFVRGEKKIACPGCESAQVERRMSLPARPMGGSGSEMDFSNLGPPKHGGGGCGGGGCGCH